MEKPFGSCFTKTELTTEEQKNLAIQVLFLLSLILRPRGSAQKSWLIRGKKIKRDDAARKMSEKREDSFTFVPELKVIKVPLSLFALYCWLPCKKALSGYALVGALKITSLKHFLQFLGRCPKCLRACMAKKGFLQECSIQSSRALWSIPSAFLFSFERFPIVSSEKKNPQTVCE